MEDMEVEFCKTIEDIIRLYQEPYSEATHQYGVVTKQGKLNPIKCKTLMTIETYKFITNRKIYNQLHRKYRIEMEGESGYNNREIIIDVWVQIAPVSIESVAPVGIGIGVNEGNGIEVVAPSCIEQPDPIIDPPSWTVYNRENYIECTKRTVSITNSTKVIIIYKIEKSSIEWIEKKIEDGFEFEVEEENNNEVEGENNNEGIAQADQEVDH
jgi:sulfite reductase beta subunit-like hemoprotein